MNNSSFRSEFRVSAGTSTPVLAICLLLLSACTTTQKVPVTQPVGACGFLGNDVCGKLTTGGKEQAGQRYVNPAAKWTQYKKVIVDPVSFWGGDTTKVSGADQQALVNYFHQQLTQELGKKFQLVDKPGAGVIKLDVAMLDAEAATPGLRSISMLIPQAHMLSNLKYLATGTFPFVGEAQAAAKMTDSQTGQVLAAAVDRQIGGGAVKTAFQWQWGDAENAITEWSKKLAEKLYSWTSGAAAP